MSLPILYFFFCCCPWRAFQSRKNWPINSVVCSCLHSSTYPICWTFITLSYVLFLNQANNWQAFNMSQFHSPSYFITWCLQELYEVGVVSPDWQGAKEARQVKWSTPDPNYISQSELQLSNLIISIDSFYYIAPSA